MAKTYKKYLGLRKYNKILSLLRGKKKVSLKEFRKLQKKASGIYPNFSDIPLSKINKKKVSVAKKVSKKPKKVSKKPKKPTLPTIQQIYQTEKSWFEPEEWFSLVDGGKYSLREFGVAYPHIPIQIIWGGAKGTIYTGKTINDPIRQFDIKGAFPTYQGSPLQELTEDMRIYYDIDLNLYEYKIYPNFYLYPAVYKDTGMLFAISVGELTKEQAKERWGILKKLQYGVIKTPKGYKKFIKKPKKTEVPPDIETIIKPPKPTIPKVKKPKVVKLPKGKKKLPKPTTTTPKLPPKRTEGEIAQIRALISDLRQDLKDGLITKKFYMEQIKELTKNLKKGGKI